MNYKHFKANLVEKGLVVEKRHHRNWMVVAILKCPHSEAAFSRITIPSEKWSTFFGQM